MINDIQAEVVLAGRLAERGRQLVQLLATNQQMSAELAALRTKVERLEADHARLQEKLTLAGYGEADSEGVDDHD